MPSIGFWIHNVEFTEDRCQKYGVPDTGAGPEELAEKLQEFYLSRLGALTRAGCIRTAGPFDERHDDSLRGMRMCQTGSLEPAGELASSDPAVAAGLVEVDAMYFCCLEAAVELGRQLREADVAGGCSHLAMSGRARSIASS